MAKEKRLIDANALIQRFDGFGWGSECDGEIVLEAVANAPTVDAVEVVRCKDCKHFFYGSECNKHSICGTYLTEFLHKPRRFLSLRRKEREWDSISIIQTASLLEKANCHQSQRK